MTAASLIGGATIVPKPPAPPTSQRRLSLPIPNPQFSRFNTSLRLPLIRASEIRPLSAVPRSPPNPSSSDDENTNNPFHRLAAAFPEALRALQAPAAAALLVGFLTVSNPLAALAVSGGRMGGSRFSSGSSRSSSTSSSSSSSSGYSSSSRPSSSSGYSSGSESYSRPSRSSSTTIYNVEIGTPSAPTNVEIGTPSAPTGIVRSGGSEWSTFLCIGVAVFGIGVWVFLTEMNEGSGLGLSPTITIHKVQVGLLGTARTLQKDLDQIAETANTSTPEVLRYILTETVLALLRHPDFCISAYSSVDTKRSFEDGERRFDQISLDERAKFDEETLLNVNNIKKHKKPSQSSKGFVNEYIVITILVAVEGKHKLPVINGSADLKQALQHLGSIPSKKIMAVEVLWTPQDERDALTECELLEKYPLLKPLYE